MLNNEKFQLMMAQKNQLSVLKKEEELEIQNLYVIVKNYKDIPSTEQGKNDSRSLISHMTNWKKSLSEDEKNGNFIFIGIEETLENFKSYLLNKCKGKLKKQWEIKFNDLNYVNDVKNLFSSQIYKHKWEQSHKGFSIFASAYAYLQYQEYELMKSIRVISHEASGRIKKFDPDSLNEEIIRKQVEIVIQKRLDDFKKELQDINLLQ
jgi:hypothetical protein